MHPRNPYKIPPDFGALALSYPALRPYVSVNEQQKATIDFTDETAERLLTEALLHRDFNLRLRLPANRLCPPIPNRLNYLLWIQDILRATYPRDAVDATGLDIGTGASAIYVLLGCKLEPQWKFFATDIDEVSLASAKRNIQLNNLCDRGIVVPSTADETPLLPLKLHENINFDFTMCNPPFYSSVEDIAKSADAKASAPHAVCTGGEVEMVTPGGESAFVCRIFRDSTFYVTRCRWFTSMVGKKSSLHEIVALIREFGVDNYAITVFVQGQTRRWAVGWSFGAVRLPDSLARISDPTLQYIMPARNNLNQSFPQTQSVEDLHSTLLDVLGSIERIVVWREETNVLPVYHSFVLDAEEDTWSRAARRKLKMPRQLSSIPQLTPDRKGGFKCRVSCVLKRQDSGRADVSLEYQWLEGFDRALYESFVSHISRKTAAALSGRNENSV